MDFLKRLFGGNPTPSDNGIYFYVRCDNCGRVLHTRLNPGNDLSLSDEGGYIVRKDEQQDSRMLNFEEAAPYVESHLRMRLAEKIYKEWTDRLRSEAYIKVFELPAVK